MHQSNHDDTFPETKLEPEHFGGGSADGSSGGPPHRPTAIGFGGDDASREEFKALLKHIKAEAGVIGSLLVGHDGLLIDHDLPDSLDENQLAVWALGMYMNSAEIVKKLGQNRLHQLICETDTGLLVIADFAGGLLVVLADKSPAGIILLMHSITQMVAR